MLLTSIIIYIILIIPLIININFYYSSNNKKLFFSINIFRIINLLGGYIETIKEGIAIHISDKKAFIIDYRSLLGVKEKVKPLKDYHFTKVEYLIEIGSEKNIINAISLAFIINYFNSHLNCILSNKKPYFDLNNKINVFENEKIFNIYFSSKIMLNILMIFLSLIKILVEKVIYAITYRKEQNRQDN